ncbi:MAG: CopG family transcriptional regulator [Actinomycetota bacterium]
MESQNITLSLPRRLLKRVKLLAVKRDTSVSGLMTDLLEELVERDDDYERARRRALALLEDARPMGTSGEASWTRDELHRR